MALRQTVGITIPQPAAPAAPIAFGAAIGIPLRAQRASYWCWAACTEMVGCGVTPQIAVQQCSLASNHVPGASAGCCQALNSSCNRGLSAAAILGVIQGTVASNATQHGPLSKSALDGELVSGRPVEVGWLWNVGGGHVVLVVDVKSSEDGNDIYTVLDPWPVNKGATTTLRFAGIQTAQSQGVWDCSFADLQ